MQLLHKFLTGRPSRPEHDPGTEQENNSLPVMQLNTILLLFLILRLTIVLMFTPQGLLNAYVDHHHYYNTALMSQQGYLPFINMWYEYPPLLAYMVQGVFGLVSGMIPMGDVYDVSFRLFSIILGLILLVFDAGVLVLLYRIMQRVWGTEQANFTGWVYAVLNLPVYYGLYSHNIVPAFFLLLAVELYLSGKNMSSAFALGFGIAAKFTPLFFLGPIVRDLWGRWRKASLYGLVSVLTVFATYLPFLIMGTGKWVAASFVALSKVSSYATVWALIDGNYGPGDYGPLATRVDLANAQVSLGNPAVIPGWLLLMVFGMIYALVFFRKTEKNPRSFVYFVTFTALLFHLWSKGWSPQWVTLLIPLLLIAFPGRQGVRYYAILTGFLFIEAPLASAFKSPALLVIAVVGRTLLFAWLSYVLARKVWAGSRAAVQEVIPA